MKKIIFSIAFFAIGLTGYSQSLDYGVKGGMNFSTLRGSDIEDAEGKIGFHIGAFGKYQISEKFYLQAEVLYSQSGAKGSEKENGVNYENSFNFSYINVPIMAKYYFTEGFSAEAGPYFGFLVSSKMKEEANVDGVKVKAETDIKKYTEGLDFGLGFGIAYDLKNGLNFGVRYNLGLSDVLKLGESTGSGIMKKYDAKNSFTQISVGYKF